MLSALHREAGWRLNLEMEPTLRAARRRSRGPGPPARSEAETDPRAGRNEVMRGSLLLRACVICWMCGTPRRLVRRTS
jgi:hypothetical protein